MLSFDTEKKKRESYLHSRNQNWTPAIKIKKEHKSPPPHTHTHIRKFEEDIEYKRPAVIVKRLYE
jgi:hypothetical protein